METALDKTFAVVRRSSFFEGIDIDDVEPFVSEGVTRLPTKEQSMIRHIAWCSVAVGICVSVCACDKPGAAEQQKESKAIGQAENARSEADKDIVAAQTDFERTREDYRHSRRTDLADLDKRILDLETEARTATGKRKADLDSGLPAVRSQRGAFVRDMQSLETTAPSAWDNAKASLDREWDALKAAVDKLH